MERLKLLLEKFCTDMVLNLQRTLVEDLNAAQTQLQARLSQELLQNFQFRQSVSTKLTSFLQERDCLLYSMQKSLDLFSLKMLGFLEQATAESARILEESTKINQRGLEKFNYLLTNYQDIISKDVRTWRTKHNDFERVLQKQVDTIDDINQVSVKLQSHFSMIEKAQHALWQDVLEYLEHNTKLLIQDDKDKSSIALCGVKEPKHQTV